MRRGFVFFLLAVLWSTPSLTVRAGEFLRGDVSGDGDINLADAQELLGFLFSGGEAPWCADAADATDSGGLDLADVLRILNFLFVGGSPPAPPYPTPGCDPTPDALDCDAECGPPRNPDPPSQLTCTVTGTVVDLGWNLTQVYDEIEILRDGVVVDVLRGGAVTWRDRVGCFDTIDYAVRGRVEERRSSTANCTVRGAAANVLPIINVLSPDDGTIVDGSAVEVSVRVEVPGGQIARVLIDGESALAELRATPVTVSRVVSLEPGPNLIRVEAVDGSGRAAFTELALGATTVVPKENFTSAFSVMIAESGLDEIERQLSPLLIKLPGLLESGLQAVYKRDTILGTGYEVEGERAVVSPLSLRLSPPRSQGGGLTISVATEEIRAIADGQIVLPLFPDDHFDIVATASGVAATANLKFRPDADRTGVEVEVDAPRVSFDLDLEISGLAVPLLDEILNAILDLFEESIESELRAAVQENLNTVATSAMTDALDGLTVDRLDLGELLLRSRFSAINEDRQGLFAHLDSSWTAKRPTSLFPDFPGSLGSSPPFPVLSGDVAPHPVDIIVSVSRDALHQTLTELARTGISRRDFDLPEVGGQVLTAGMLSQLFLVPFDCLAGVDSLTPVRGRIELRKPPVLDLGDHGATDGRVAVGVDELVLVFTAGAIDLFAVSAAFAVEGRLEVADSALTLSISSSDGEDADSLADGIVGGFEGIDIELAYEAFDLPDEVVTNLIEEILPLLGEPLSETLEQLEHTVPLPSLRFDIDGDGSTSELGIERCTLLAVDTDGGDADWLCLLCDVRSRIAAHPGCQFLAGASEKRTLTDSSEAGPSLASTAERLAMAWRGNGNRRLNIMTSTDGLSFSNKVTLEETSARAPALAAFNGRFVLAWTGVGNDRLNILQSSDGRTWSNKVTLRDTSTSSPALAVFAGRLVIAWRGRGNDRLNVMSSFDGVGWSNKSTLPETTRSTPALASLGDELLLGWRGVGNNRLNVIRSADARSFRGKVTLDDTTSTRPYLHVIEATGQAYLVWQGVGNQRLNVLDSTDGIRWRNKITLNERCRGGPVLYGFQDRFILWAWTGVDRSHRLNIVRCRAP